MSFATLRPWIRCSQRAPRRSLKVVDTTARRFAATAAAATAQKQKLETPDDWTDMQLRRTEYESLIDHFSQYGSTQTRENTFRPHHTLNKPVAPSNITLSALLASGAHFGHATSLMNPNFMPYAYGERAGITIIDLDHTLPLLRRAASVVRGVAAREGSILFVGTRPDLRNAVRKAAERMGAQGFHVGEKWLPGTLTNRIQMFGPEVAEEMQVIPDLVVFLNPIPNIHAIRECTLEHVPTIGIVDSNVDPRIVMYPIPANDESTRTAELIAGVLSIAGREGVALGQQERARLDRKMKGVQRGREQRVSRRHD